MVGDIQGITRWYNTTFKTMIEPNLIFTIKNPTGSVYYTAGWQFGQKLGENPVYYYPLQVTTA